MTKDEDSTAESARHRTSGLLFGGRLYEPCASSFTVCGMCRLTEQPGLSDALFTAVLTSLGLHAFTELRALLKLKLQALGNPQTCLKNLPTTSIRQW